MIIDRDRRRYKLDKNIRDVFPTIREKMDIADVNLEVFLEHHAPDKRSLVSIAKHLCGGATDLTLASLENQ